MDLVKGKLEGIYIAACISTPDQKVQMTIRCLNPTEQPLHLAVGAVVRSYMGLEKSDIETTNPENPQRRRIQDSVPPNILPLWEGETVKCENHERKLQELLTTFAHVVLVAEGFDGHLLQLGEVLTRLRAAGLKLKPSQA